MTKVPSLSYDRVIRALRRDGWVVVWQRGSHIRLHKRTPDRTLKLIVPAHQPIKRSTLSHILKQARLTEKSSTAAHAQDVRQPKRRMMRLSHNVVRFEMLLVATTVMACGSKVTPYDPFKVPREELVARTKTVALTQLALPADIPDPDHVRDTFRPLIESRMRAAGFAVVLEEEFESRWKRASEGEGGPYDPNSGKFNVEKAKVIRQRVFKSLQSELGVDAVLELGIVPVVVEFAAGRARWDGTFQDMQPGAVVKGVFLGSWSSGKVGALSLVARLRDMEDQILFSNAGGIEVTAKLSFGDKFVPVPVAELLKDPERNAAAVRLALAQLTGETTKSKGPN